MAFINPDNELWQNILESHSCDFYNLPGYVQLEAKVLNGEAIGWYYQSGSSQYLIPLIKRKINLNGKTFYDLVSPYGYPGIIAPENQAADDLIPVLALFNTEARQSGFISSFVRLHPILNNYLFVQNEHFSQHFHGKTISVNLNKSVEQIRTSYSLNHRRNIRRLINMGFSTQINQWQYLSDFWNIYTQTMQRKHASGRYFFNLAYFTDLRDIGHNSVTLLTTHDNNGVMASGGVFTQTGGLVQFHLGGTASALEKISPSKLMMDSAIVHAKNSGAASMHLGGGFGASTSDGLYRFKSGFGNVVHQFSTLRFIHHNEAYKALSNANLLKTNSDLGSKFFPAYRSL